MAANSLLLKMKVKDDSYPIFKEELKKMEEKYGPFSKNDNIMHVFDMMKEGKNPNQANKEHLLNLIKVLCKKLDIVEEVTEDSSENHDDDNNARSTNPEPNDKQETICKFYEKKNCKYGRSGKDCTYQHPPPCKKFEMFGNEEKGCHDTNCKKLHRKVCKYFMRKKICKFGENCRLLHPKKLKPQNQNLKQTQNQRRGGIDDFAVEQKNTNVRFVNEPLHQSKISSQFQGNSAFLGHNPIPNQSYWEKEKQVREPFLDPPFLDPQQKQMVDYMMKIMNQRLNSIEEIKMKQNYYH